jgi:hypothetical protein
MAEVIFEDYVYGTSVSAEINILKLKLIYDVYKHTKVRNILHLWISDPEFRVGNLARMDLCTMMLLKLIH